MMEHGAGLPHRGAHLLVDVRAVLDRADPGLDRGHDSWLAVSVRRDHPVGHAGHLDDRGQLLCGELLVDGVVHLGHHAAADADLDHLGVAAQLLADGPGALGRAVAQP